MHDRIRICIADDHKLMLEGLASLIESIPDFQLVAKFDSGKALVNAMNEGRLSTDVCIIDIEMPEMDGVETTRVITQNFPNVKVIALTMHQESHFVNKMIAAGAGGYLLKNVDRDVFVRSVHLLMNGKEFISEGIFNNKMHTSHDPLTHREREILKKIALGKSNKEIGDELFISDRTVDTHRTNIKRKLKLNSLAQLIQYTKDHGLD